MKPWGIVIQSTSPANSYSWFHGISRADANKVLRDVANDLEHQEAHAQEEAL